jgi:anaerobic selenocysteine-containing dehydrogenase
MAPRLREALQVLRRGFESPEEFPYTETTLASEYKEVERHRVGCFLCPHGCTCEVQIREGRVVNIEGNPDDPFSEGRNCPKLRMGTQFLYNSNRNLYPLKRVGERGEGKFQRISWEQALDEIASRLKTLREIHGGEALAMWISSRSAMDARFVPAHLFAQMYGVVNEEKSAFLCQSSGTVALRDVFGFEAMPNAWSREDLGSARLHLVVGANPMESHATGWGLINDERLKRGAPLIVADPRQSMTASKADLWLPLRPATDMALALGLIHYLITEDLYDHAFVERWTVGFEEIRRQVLEKEYTLEWASRVMDVPLRDLEQTAEAYGFLKPAVIWANTAIGHHTTGYYTHRCFALLSALAGNIGKKGGCYASMGNGRIEVKATAPEGRRYRPKRKRISRNPIAWIEAMRTGEPYLIRGLITTGNLLTMWADTERLKEALQNLDILVHLETFPHETSAWADYVLPIASWIEAGGPAPESCDRRFIWVEKLVDPPGEAKPDRYFWVELGKRFGWGDVLTEDLKDPVACWNRGVKDPASWLARGITAERLRAQPSRWLRGPVLSEEEPGIDTLYLEGTTFPGTDKRFPTRSGKVELWTPELEAKLNHYGLSARPVFHTEKEHLVDLPYLEREEWIESRHDENVWTHRVRIVDAPRPREFERYDTYLITGRPGAPHFHSITHWFWQAQEMRPDPFVQIHPLKAQALGIEDGDEVEVETMHGTARGRAWVTEGIRVDSVFMPMGWGERQPFTQWSSVNNLTDHLQRDPIGYQSNFKTYICRVRRVR